MLFVKHIELKLIGLAVLKFYETMTYCVILWQGCSLWHKLPSVFNGITPALFISVICFLSNLKRSLQDVYSYILSNCTSWLIVTTSGHVFHLFLECWFTLVSCGMMELHRNDYHSGIFHNRRLGNSS